MGSLTKTTTLYLIPLPIIEGGLHTLSPKVTEVTANLKHYVVENTRTARRFIRQLQPTLPLEPIQFLEIDKNNGADLLVFRQWVKEGHHIGIMSEAGCPGIADPGAQLVAEAHLLQVKVEPLTGPSAVLLALMASGLNGQSFAFNGYLPIKEPARSKKIKELENRSRQDSQTQLFIETPYRNKAIFDDLLKSLSPTTMICVAQHLTAPSEFIRTLSVSQWQKNMPVFEKAPAVFLFLAK